MNGLGVSGLGEDGLAEVLSRVARELRAERGVEDTLRAVVRAAVDTVPGADRGGISLIGAGRQVTARAPTDVVVGELDRLQSELGQGPCLDAVREPVVSVEDMAAETRWPLFAAAARTRGVAAMLSLRLFVSDAGLGALNLYAATAGAFPVEAAGIGQMFAAHAAVVLVGAQHEEQLHTAMDSREVIGQAQGILMAQNTITGKEAFAMLAAASQRTNTKMRDLAQHIVADLDGRAVQTQPRPAPPGP